MKTVFIFVLAIINIMLIGVLYSSKMYEKEEKRIMIQNVSAILSKNKILLPETLEIPDSPEISNYYIEKMFGSDSEMLIKFLGENYTRQSENTYKSDSGTLTVSGDGFVFQKAALGDLVTDFSQENVEKLCREEMKALGMMYEAYAFNGFNLVDNGTRAVFTVKREKAEFFDAYVSFDISDKGIYTVSGRNVISGMSVSGGTSPYYNVLSILADLAKNEKIEKNTAQSIVSIKPGYYIGKTAQSYRNILAIPVWQIATDRGVILHYDARNGTEIVE
jgi:hypothetical protein